LNNFDYAQKRFIDWLFRKRSVGLSFAKLGSSLMILSVIGGVVAQLTYQNEGTVFTFDFDSTNTSAAFISTIMFFLGTLIVTYGVFRARQEYQEELRRWEKRLVLVIEQRGLRDTTDTPLVDFIPDSLEGRRDQLIIDIRENIKDGYITSPEAALEKVRHIKRDIQSRIGRLDIQDVSICYGGLFPVPLSFLTGFILDDNSKISVFDWHRSSEHWCELNKEDDGDRFIIEDNGLAPSDEVVVAVSVSYLADLENINDSFPGLPLFHLRLAEIDFNNHWSKLKQDAWALQFCELIKALMAKGVKKIHLVIAAQNSVAFKLGRSYDFRLLPEAIVYQYERSRRPAYPWGVKLSTHGVENSTIAENAFSATNKGLNHA